MSTESKRFSDREVALIIQTALNIEKGEHHAESGGFLLSEIEDIARESGISVDHIRLAAEKILDREKKNRSRLWFGSETSIERLDIVPQNLTQDQLERLDRTLPVLTSLSESSIGSGGTLTWKRSLIKSFLDGFPLRLSLKQAENGTEIAASANLNSLAAVFFTISGGLGILVGIKLSLAVLLLIGIGSIGLPISAAILLGGGLVGLGGAWLLARLAFGSFVKRSRQKIANIVDKIKASILSMKE